MNAARSTRPPTSRLFVAFVATSAVLIAGCGEIGEPDYGLGSQTAITEPVPKQQGDPTDTTTIAGTELVPEADVFTPPRPADYTPSLLATTADGVMIVQGEGALSGAADPVGARLLAPPLGTLSARRVIDDFFGGLVVEAAAGGIFWYREPGGAPVIVAEPGATLLDVGFLDATSQLYVFVLASSGEVERIRLADSVRTPFATLDEGQSILDFSAGDGVQAAVIADGECGALVFFDATGSRVNLGGPQELDCPVSRRPSFGSVALNPDATEVAYTEVVYRSDGIAASTDVVVRILGSNTERFRTTVGEPGQSIKGLVFDGQRVSFVRSDDADSAIVLLDTTGFSAATGEANSVDVALPVAPIEGAFSRQPLANGW